MLNAARKILVVEDDDLKYADLHRILVEHCLEASIDRATNVVGAETLLASSKYDFLVLDISMNIAKGSLGPMRGGHANLGGLAIAEKMYLEGIECPTVIVTGFDYFRRGGLKRGDNEIISLSELEERARKLLGSGLIGCVRYGSEKWEQVFASLLRGA